MASIRRQTAKKCRIKDILKGRYVKREGWDPNYFETIVGKVSRANILGTIVSTEENSFLIDDGTGAIQLRSFEEENIFSGKKLGDVVLVIGKPRVYNEQIFLVPEIIKKIENLSWIKFRAEELKNNASKTPVEEEIIFEEKNVSDISGTLAESVMKKITELDTGQGVKITDVIAFFNSNETNNVINILIEQGEIFEIKPGVVKTI
ncbi:MAG: hypothetical protein ABH828_06065 [archaeon]